MPPDRTDKDSPESAGSPDVPAKQRKRPGRVPVSCAECRRLKLRCDRKVPCETCTKRGCAALCPDGACRLLITGGKGTRQAVADVEDLKKKIAELSTRSSQLENALRTIHAAISDEPHPLLIDASAVNTSAATPPDSSNSNVDGPSLTSEEADVLDAFGTLTLGPRGETRFFGQTSRISSMPRASDRGRAFSPRLTKELIDEANKELDVQCQSLELGMELLGLLPPLSQACAMCEKFLEFGAFLWYPLPRQYIFDDIVSLAYQTWKHKCNIATTHQLALMWMIFALGTLFDLDRPPYAAEAHEYYLLARLALRFAPPAHDTTLISIQTMIYMAQYLEMSDCEPAHTQSHKAWMQIGQAVKLGHSVHMNSDRWRLSDDIRNQRNHVFWQLFFQDTWLSFGFGRPPTINLAFVDCEVPRDCDHVCAEGPGGVFHVWQWQYTKLLYSIMNTAFGAKAPNYATVMDLDRRVRDFPVPEALRVTYQSMDMPIKDAEVPTLQRLVGTLLKETTLLNLHRAYFSQAVNDMPLDPLKHRYGPSVMAIYRSAWRIIAIAKCSYKLVPGIAGRIGLVWSYSLAAAIVMCLLVIRAPSTNLAKSSLAELDRLTELFEEAGNRSQIASNNVDVVRRMRKQAHDAFNKVSASEESVRMDNELDRLGGKTHLICPNRSDGDDDDEFGGCGNSERYRVETERLRVMRQVAENAKAARNAAASTNGTAAPEAPLVQPDMIHPTIMQDMRAFDVSTLGADDLHGIGSAAFALDFGSDTFDPSTSDLSLFPDFDFGAGASTGGADGAAGGVEWVRAERKRAPVLDATWQAFVEQLGF
ncbi:uncharacterized protein BXZ73DRAFT_90043 [Epithele typhae]|uniref:uncharacterized protein n=1 Tax=Epithele typhae TaxID=378194 RepID=UPI0020084C10|nr:uncharacterized protein BXZ73DRAFT_90043 [Epithele typhae]KAH9932118.1 hypothetical protein BXZ73DRAFT_90043 [Epithele typhae]